MRGVNLYAALFILLGTVPIVVGGAGLASFLLLRAGYGFLVWGVLPFLALILISVVLGVILGRAAGGNLPGTGRRDGLEEKPRGGSPRRGPRRGDDV